MKRSKYIIFNENGVECAIIFDEMIDHSDFKKFNPISAGFINIWSENNQLKIACYGRSTSLKLKSREEDKKLVERQIISEY